MKSAKRFFLLRCDGEEPNGEGIDKTGFLLLYDMTYKPKACQHSLHLTGGYAGRFHGFEFSSVSTASLSPPTCHEREPLGAPVTFFDIPQLFKTLHVYHQTTMQTNLLYC
jgi:hypothetical protein